MSPFGGSVTKLGVGLKAGQHNETRPVLKLPEPSWRIRDSNCPVQCNAEKQPMGQVVGAVELELELVRKPPVMAQTLLAMALTPPVTSDIHPKVHFFLSKTLFGGFCFDF